MRDYGQIQCAFWQSADAQSFSDSAKLLAAYLMTGPHSNGLGCYRLPDGYITADLGWSIDKVSKAFGELIERRFVQRCEASGFILLPKFLRWNPIGNPKIAAARIKELRQIPQTSVLYELACWCLAAFGGAHVPTDFLSYCSDQRKKIAARVPDSVRKQVYERDGNSCVICAATADLTIDHILPRALGGGHTVDNLRTLCRSCNSKRPIFDEEAIASQCYGNGIDTLSKQEQEKNRTDPIGTEAASAAKKLHEEIVAAYHQALPELPKVRIWSEDRRKTLDARIRETVKRGKPADTADYWQQFFAKVSRSDWLCGRAGKDWRADWDWLMGPENFRHVLEGRYDKQTGGTHGRSYAPANTAALS